MSLRSNLHWLVLGAVALLLYGYFALIAQMQLGGDIIDYYGATETILDHGGLDLTTENQQALSEKLNPGYFESYYNIPGRDGNKYPVHFTFYSLLLLPFRLILTILNQDELKSFWFLNITILIATIAVIWKKLVAKSADRLVLLALVISSPLISFIKWPGPDLYFLSLLLVTVFAFFNRKFLLATFLVAFASWHSQPLIVLSALLGIYTIINQSSLEGHSKIEKLSIHLPSVFKVSLASAIAFVPYLSNLLLFGMFTPWYAIPDGWTKWFGFGLHNASFPKLFEQFFDLNIGLFWYMPLTMLLGIAGLIWLIIKKKTRFLAISLASFTLITAFFYQTNPAWHYGTVGYGPTRHIAFVIPVLIYFALQAFHQKWSRLFLVILIIISQTFILSFNGLLEPNLGKSHFHTPLAEYVLNNYPKLYNPTPEIFIDRTNHTDLGYPTTAIYKNGETCTKAYVLVGQQEILQAECGIIPEEYELKLVDPYQSVANYPRTLKVISATFWPAGQGCADWFSPTPEKPYVCMDTIEKVIEETGIIDAKRITELPEYPDAGIWKLVDGDPVEITVPPGYFIHRFSFEGMYVDF